MVDRGDEIVDRPFEALDEGGDETLRTRAHVDRRRLEEQACGDLRHLRIDIEHRLALAVDGDVDLLALRRAAEEEAVGVAVELDAELVVAVGGKRVHDGNAAARPERRAIDASQLRRRFRHAVVRFSGLGVRIADRKRSHRARRAQIAFHQRGRQRLRIGDVVETLADGIGRQQSVDVDVEREEILHRARVLDAIEPLERAAPRIGCDRRRLVDSRLERGRERAQRRLVGPPRARRRHHARAQLADHFLGDVRVLGRGGRVERSQ